MRILTIHIRRVQRRVVSFSLLHNFTPTPKILVWGVTVIVKGGDYRDTSHDRRRGRTVSGRGAGYHLPEGPSGRNPGGENGEDVAVPQRDIGQVAQRFRVGNCEKTLTNTQFVTKSSFISLWDFVLVGAQRGVRVPTGEWCVRPTLRSR